MIVLDSNILIYHLNNDLKVSAAIAAWRKSQEYFIISVISEIELLSLPVQDRVIIEPIQRLLSKLTIIPVDRQVAAAAATIRHNTKLKLGDSIIVATAQVLGAPLVTGDQDILQKAKHLIKFLQYN